MRQRFRPRPRVRPEVEPLEGRFCLDGGGLTVTVTPGPLAGPDMTPVYLAQANGVAPLGQTVTNDDGIHEVEDATQEVVVGLPFSAADWVLVGTAILAPTAGIVVYRLARD